MVDRRFAIAAACAQLLACGPSESDGRRSWSSGFLDLAAGPAKTCAVRKDGTVDCWGEGQTSTKPFHTDSSDGRFVRVGTDGECVYALTDAHKLKSVSPSKRCQTPPGGKQTEFAIGSTSCSIAHDETMRCWRTIGTGEICLPSKGGGTKCTPFQQAKPSEPFPDQHFLRVAVGGSQSCAIRTDGTIKCWPGMDDSPSGEDFVDIAVGDGFACAVDGSGKASCWGTPPEPPSGVRFSRISANGARVCGVEKGGAVRCWGEAFRWRTYTYAPSKGDFADVSVGTSHACARKENGDAACWGVNQQGQVTGTPPSRLFRN